MSTLSQFGGGAPTTSIVNFYSPGGVSSGSVLAAGAVSNSRNLLSGALTANTLKTMLTVNGGGEVPLLFVTTLDTTSRTIRVRVTVDGVVAYDATSNAITLGNQGVVIMGQAVTTSYVAAVPPGIRFNSSLVVEVASSVNEAGTGNAQLLLAYQLNKR